MADRHVENPAGAGMSGQGSKLRLRCSAAAAAIVIAALGASLFWRPRPLLFWNASASSPVGLYAMTSASAARVGDMVVAWPPPSARRLGAARAYVPFDVPLVKPVAAVAGDRVCARGDRIFINGRPVALRRQRDPAGRPMPHWSGCACLKHGDLFLLSHAGPLAFDGRYFGISHVSDIIGKARLLWAKPAKDSGYD